MRSLGLSADQIFYPELTEADPMLTQITHLAASCTEQQKRMVVRFIRMLQDEELRGLKIAVFAGTPLFLCFSDISFYNL